MLELVGQEPTRSMGVIGRHPEPELDCALMYLQALMVSKQ